MKWGGRWSWVSLPLLFCFFFFPLVFQGKVFSQSDVLCFFPPWSTSCPPGLSHPSNSLLSDLSLQFYPFAVYTRDRLSEGQLPLWNPYILGGAPFLANMQSAIFYPTSLLLLLLPVETAWSVSALVRLGVAGLSTYGLARALALSTWSAVFAGIIFMFCAFNIVWLNHPHTNVAVCLPLLLLGIERTYAGRKSAPFILALATALIFLGGHPETAFHVSIAAGLYSLVRLGQLWADDPRKQWRVLSRLLGGYALGVLGSAIVLIPFLEALLESGITTYRDRMPREAFVLPFQALWTFITPDIFGHPALGEFSGPLNYNDRTGYVGLVPLVLAIAVFPTVIWDRKVQIFAGLAVFALLVALGIPPVADLFSLLPFAHHAPQQRLLLVYEFSVALLAACALDQLLRSSSRFLSSFSLFFSGGLCLVLGGLWFELFLPLPASARAGIVRALFIVLVFLVWGGLYRRGAFAGRIFATGICGLTFVDLLLFGAGYTPVADSETVLTSPPPSVRFLQQQPGPFRIAGVGERGILIPNTAMLYDLMDARGYEPMAPGRMLHFFEEALKGEVDLGGSLYLITHEELTGPVRRAFDLLNVRYFLSSKELTAPNLEKVYDAEIKIYRNLTALPRAFVVHEARIVPDASSALQLIAQGDVDIHAEVVLEEMPEVEGKREDEKAEEQKASQVRVSMYSPDRVEIEAEATKPGFLVLGDTYFRGWRVFVNDRETPMFRANYLLRAVPLQAGSSQVAFVYDPLSFKLGLGLSLLAGGIGIGWLAFSVMYWRSPPARKNLA